MERSLQTAEWFSTLRKKTIKYVRLNINKYYKQYRQNHVEVEDIADEFITKWLTPSDGRKHDRPMQTWPDRFDPETMNLDTCVKVMVIRGLIDMSRTDRKRMYSIDAYVEEKGESFYNIESLITKKFSFNNSDIAESAKKFDKLGKKTKQTLIQEYFTVRKKMSAEGKSFFDSVFGVKPISVRVFDNSMSEVEASSVYINNYDIRMDDRNDLRKCFVNSIDRNAITLCVDGKLIPFDKSSGVDKVDGTLSISTSDLMSCEEIGKWKYTYVPKDDFAQFCQTL